MKRKEQTRLRTENNELFLRSQLVKLKELEVEIDALKRSMRITEENEDIIDGLTSSEIMEFGQKILDNIFNPELEIYLEVSGTEEDEEGFADGIKLEIYKDIVRIAHEEIYLYPTKEYLKEIIYTMITEEAVRNLIKD